MIYTFTKRNLRMIFNGWCGYIHVHKRSKKKLKRIFISMINWKLSRHLRRWSDGAKVVKEEALAGQQSALADEITSRNQMLGEFVNESDNQSLQEKRIIQDARRCA